MKRKKKEKKSDFVDSNKSFEVYRKGAFIGGLIGGGTGLIWGKKIILCTVVGIIAGGWIAYEVNKEDEKILSVKNFKD